MAFYDNTTYKLINPQKVAFTGTSAQSAVLSSNIKIARVSADAACYIAFGSNPTATTSSHFLPAGVVEYIQVNDSQKIAALQVSAAGTLYISEATA